MDVLHGDEQRRTGSNGSEATTSTGAKYVSAPKGKAEEVEGAQHLPEPATAALCTCFTGLTHGNHHAICHFGPQELEMNPFEEKWG